MTGLDLYLKAALSVAADWDGSPSELSWTRLKQALPASERSGENAPAKFSAVLNAAGIRCIVTDGRAEVWPCKPAYGFYTRVLV